MMKQIVIACVFAMGLCSCTTEVCKCSIPKENNAREIPYVVRDSLPSDVYEKFQRNEGESPRLGLVSTARSACGVADAVLKAIYGDEIIDGEQPFSVVLFDQTWYIEGAFKNEDYYTGGLFYIEIRRNDGKILRAFHSK